MEAIIIKISQLIFSLVILVFFHELGHFAFARLFGVRVDKFYLFFNPRFSLVRAKKIGGKWRFRFFSRNVSSLSADDLPADDWRNYPEQTEWGIGWLPLGGYCKIAGMVDESMDRAQLAAAPQKWEYRGVSAWKRLPIIAGGVLVNFVMALAIYCAVLFTWGEKYIPMQNFTAGFDFSPTAQHYGFRDGDIITKADSLSLDRYDEFSIRKMLSAHTIQVVREGRDTTLALPEQFAEDVLFRKELFAAPRMPFVADSFTDPSPAQKAGIRAGDSLVSLNGKLYPSFTRFAENLNLHKQTPVEIGFYRNGELQTLTITTDSAGRIGIYPAGYKCFFEVEEIRYDALSAIPAGICLGVEKLKGYVSDFKYVFTKKGVENLGGFKSMTQLYSPTWEWQSFWEMTAFLSLILAFMNFLPIPGLDGGHLLFVLYELITRRKPSQKFMENAQAAGMIFLVGLMIFANLNDFI